MQRALLLLLIAVSYLLFAGRPTWTLVPLLCLAAATVLVAPRRTLSFQKIWRPLDLALLALMVGIVAQMVPLPPQLLGVLSPHGAELHASLRLPELGKSTNGWLPISINPAATAGSLATVALGVLSFWIARGIFSAGGSTRWFCRALAIVGGAAAVAAVVFRATSPGLVFGILEPAARSANPFGAFVNRNHFGGWLLMMAAPVGGYLIAHLRTHPGYRQKLRIGIREFMASGAMVTAMLGLGIVGVLLLTLSRSAVAGLGTAAICGWMLGRRRLSFERTNLPALLILIGVVMLAAVLFVDISGWATRVGESFDVADGGSNRMRIWRESLPMVGDFWLTGTGAGTFSDAMTKYQQSRIWVGSMNLWAHFNNAHSAYLQVVAEGGLLLTIPALAALVSVVSLGRRAVRDDVGEMLWVRIGAAGGLAGMAVQNIWETSLIMPANAVVCGTLAGLMLYQRVSSRSTRAAAESRPIAKVAR